MCNNIKVPSQKRKKYEVQVSVAVVKRCYDVIYFVLIFVLLVIVVVVVMTELLSVSIK